MKKIVIFGTGDFADILFEIIVKKLKKRVVAFCLDDEFYKEQLYQGYPVIPFSRLTQHYPATRFDVVLGFIGREMFQQRQRKFEQLRMLGYSMDNLIYPSVEMPKAIGCGNIILQNVSIGEFVEIGNANIIWPGTVLPHHNIIGSYNNISPCVSLSGYSKIGDNCFIGNNSTIKNDVRVADKTFVGAGAYITGDTSPYDVIVPVRSVKLENKSSLDFY